ncbi:TIGR02710 family CRISPR-associated CARF protein, partial [Prochlorothrix hollandica]
ETRLQNIYQKIREVYEKWERPTRIAVDPTGGTKAMVAGCTLAGNLIGADLVYVSSDYNTILRKPNPGSESLILLDNPYDVFGDLEFTKAQALFRQLDYSSSKIILENLEHKTSTPDRYKPLALLCSAYAHWDDLKIKDSVTDLRLSKDCLQRYLRLKTDSTILSSYPTILEQQIQTLENLDLSLNELGENKTVALSKPNLYLPLMGTLRACAIRQEKRGKRDVATLLWYRLLELLSQQRLSTYGLDTKCPDYNNSQLQNKISSDSLLEKYITCGLSTSKKGVKPENMTELPNIIDLINGYKLLKALDDPLAIDQDLNRITNQVNIRNNSIFAHGFKPLNDNSFMSFKTLVESLVDIFKTIQPENQAYWNDCIFVEEIV